MERSKTQDLLTVTYLQQTTEARSPEFIRKTPSYGRIMNVFDKNSDEQISNMLNYIREHPLPLGTGLKELYHLEARWRNIDYFKERSKTLPPLSQEDPYSVDMLLS